MKVIKPNSISSSGGSFTRSTYGTYTDSTGILRIAAINTPRLGYYYSLTTPVYRGLIIESSATNLITYSEEFSNVIYTKNNTAVSTTSVLSPYNIAGDYTDKLEESTTTGQHNIVTSIVTTPSATYTFSVFVKAAGRSWVYLNIDGTNGRYFDLANGVLGTLVGTCTASIERFANSWFRCSITAVVSSGFTSPFIVLANADNSSSYTGVVSTGVYIWGAQFELGSLTSYFYTFGGTATRAADVITGTGLIYTNVTDTNPTYSASTTYLENDKVVYNNYIYQSLQSSNINHQPDISSLWWVQLTPNNITAPFDNSISTAATKTNDMIYIVSTGTIDSIGFVDSKCNSLVAHVMDYTTKTTLAMPSVSVGTGTGTNAFTSSFTPITTTTNPTIVTITLNNIAGTQFSEVSIGNFVFGTAYDIGKVQYGAQIGIVDYSIKDTDEFGNTSFVKRAYSSRLNVDLYITKLYVGYILELFSSLRATPALWITVPDDAIYSDPLTIFGYYKDFTVTISYPSHSMCSLQIEGLT